jgi:hypothetical protein
MKKKSANSLYRVHRDHRQQPDLVGEAARHAVETAGKTLRDLRVAEVTSWTW